MPALCSCENGPMIDYILVDSAPVEGGGYLMKARILWYEELEYSGFFEEKVGAPCETDHELVWIPLKNASEKMLVPIQRYAVECYLKVL